MKKAILAAIFAIGAVGVFASPGQFGVAVAQEQAPTPEARARAIVAAMTSGTPGAFEQAAQENYTAAHLAQKQPSDRALLAQRVTALFGPMEVTNIAAEGNILRVSVRGQTGMQGVLTMTFEDSGDHRINEIHFQATPAASP